MDKIISARINESIAHLLDNLAKQLHVTKKKILEDAIRDFANKINPESGTDIFTQTCGAWQRKESADEIIEKAHEAFQKSMERYMK